MKTLLIFTVFVLFNIVNAQWITSTAPESSLFACPGFEPGVVTQSDGSSIVSGYLEDWIFAQKFDENGNKLWPQYLIVHQNDSSDYCINTRIFSDGHGGALFIWQDARLKYIHGNSKSLQLIAQRIDSNGQKRWGSGGTIFVDIESNLVRYNIAPQNNGDVIIITEEVDSGYTGASLLNKLNAISIDESGGINWKKTIDSNSISLSLGYQFCANYFDKILLRTNNRGTIFLTSEGSIFNTINLTGYIEYTIDNSYSLYSFKNPVNRQRGDSIFQFFPVDKFNSQMNILWESGFEIFSDGDGFTNTRDPIVVDNRGGIYFISSQYINPGKRFTRLSHLDSMGRNMWDLDKIYINDFVVMVGGKALDGGVAMIYFGDARSAVRFDYNGNPKWSNQPITVFKDPFDKAFFTKCESDYDGGFVCAFWRTEGGVFVKHSGRMGKVGVLTRMKRSENEITGNYLHQNYPNPFNSSTNISFSVHTSGNIKIAIYDMLGREIEVVHEGYLDKGSYNFNWSAISLSSGVYIYKLASQNAVVTKKMLLVK